MAATDAQLRSPKIGALANDADDAALQTANTQRQNWEIRQLPGQGHPFVVKLRT